MAKTVDNIDFEHKTVDKLLKSENFEIALKIRMPVNDANV